MSWAAAMRQGPWLAGRPRRWRRRAGRWLCCPMPLSRTRLLGAPFVLCKPNREPACRGSGSAVLSAPQALVLWGPRYSRLRGRHAPMLFEVSQQDKHAWCCAHLSFEGQKYEMLNKHTVLALLMLWCGCESRAHQDAQPIHLQTQLSSHAACASGCSTARFSLLAHAAAMGAVLDRQMVAASVPSSVDKCLVHAALGLPCVHSQHLANLSHPHQRQACAAGCCTVRSPCRCILRPRARRPLSCRLQPAHQAAPASGWCMRRWGRTASMRSPTAGGGASRCAPARACGSTTRRRTAPSTPSSTLAPLMRRRVCLMKISSRNVSLFWKHSKPKGQSVVAHGDAPCLVRMRYTHIALRGTGDAVI